MQQRTPVSIITGFLGSGKTTLLNRLLQNPAMAGAAVIINEFGEIGLDHLLIATPNENTVLLASGCICCTVRGDLVDTLRGLDRQREKGQLPPFDRVLIETTGLADPVPIIQTVVTDEKLAPRYELDGVLTLVDVVNGMQQLDTQPEAVKQAAVADRLVLTKTDIAPAAEDLLSRLTRLNPGALRLTADRGDIGAHHLFGAQLGTQAGPDELSRWLPEAAVAQAEARYKPLQTHDDHIRAYSVHLEEPVSTNGDGRLVDCPRILARRPTAACERPAQRRRPTGGGARGANTDSRAGNARALARRGSPFAAGVHHARSHAPADREHARRAAPAHHQPIAEATAAGPAGLCKIRRSDEKNALKALLHYRPLRLTLRSGITTVPGTLHGVHQCRSALQTREY